MLQKKMALARVLNTMMTLLVLGTCDEALGAINGV